MLLRNYSTDQMILQQENAALFEDGVKIHKLTAPYTLRYNRMYSGSIAEVLMRR